MKSILNVNLPSGKIAALILAIEELNTHIESGARFGNTTLTWIISNTHAGDVYRLDGRVRVQAVLTRDVGNIWSEALQFERIVGNNRMLQVVRSTEVEIVINLDNGHISYYPNGRLGSVVEAVSYIAQQLFPGPKHTA